MSQPSAGIRRRTILGVGLATLAGAGLATPPVIAHAEISREGWVRSQIARMTLEQKVGQLFVMHVYGSDASAADPRNVTEYGVASPAEVVRKYHLGGVIYFAWSDNLPDPVTVAKLSNALQRASLSGPDKVRIPLTISTDQETGLVARMPAPGTAFPGAMALGATGDPQLSFETYQITGKELRAIGINTDYAPDADVNVNPANPVIGVRSFSSVPTVVGAMVIEAVRGLQSTQVSATAKHFPGHGDTDVDSHYGFPIITHTRAEWDQIDAVPFKAAIAVGIDSIMTAHIDVPALDPSGDPATLSRPIVTGVLRGELGFDGVVVTDSLRMDGVRQKYGDAEVAVRAVEAGVDVLLDTPAGDIQYNAVLEAVKSGRISMRRLDQSVTRILRMKYARGVPQRPFVDETAVLSVVGSAAHVQRAQEITDRSITVLRDDAELIPLPAGEVYITGYGVTTSANLAASMTAHGHPATAKPVGASPTPAAIATAVAESANYAVTVVLSYGAFKSVNQQNLVAALVEAGRKVVVVAVGTPYDIAALPTAGSYVATYGYGQVSTESVAKLLNGEIIAAGRLPVSIPTVADPTVELYPVGAGIDS